MELVIHYENIFKIRFLAVASIFIFNSFGVTEAKAQGPLNDILKRMEEHRKSLQTLKADVTMDKYNPQLDVHDVNQGSVIYLPGKMTVKCISGLVGQNPSKKNFL